MWPKILVTAFCLLALALAFCGCPTAPARSAIEDVFQRIDSPEIAFTTMKRSIHNDNKDTFYYLLSADVRGEYPFWMIQQGWSEIKQQLNINVSQSRIRAVEFLATSPFPPRPAARVAVEYPHPEGGTVVENFLLLLEQAYDYEEKFPQWRLMYPYEPYQANAVWFRKLREQQKNENR